MINFKKAFTLVEMMIVVIIIGILMSVVLPKLEISQIKQRNIERTMSIKNIKKNIINTIKSNTWIVEQLSWINTYCLNNKVRSILWDKIYKQDISSNHINYWTQPQGCKWQYGFVYDKKLNEIWLITTLDDGEGVLDSNQKKELIEQRKFHKNSNYNINLNYYKNLSWNIKNFQNIFEKKKWKLNLWETTTWNSYIEIINLNYLLWKK